MRVRPDYSSDEFSDFDKDDVYCIPCIKSVHKAPEVDYKTQLYESTLYGSTEEFIKLLNNNSNKFDFDYDGWTLLLVTASHGQHEKMSYLLKLGADPNYNYNSFTPLLAVCNATKPEAELMQCIEVLVEYKVRLVIEDRHGVTPLMYASRHGHANIVNYLLAKCPDSVNKSDSESLTALFYAVMYNHADVVELLLDAKANSNLIDLQGRTVLDIAVLKQYNDIIELLHPGYVQQQEEQNMAMHQDKANQVVYDYITQFKNNLPTSDIQYSGFYTNVIEMLNACELLDFSSGIIEKQMSLFMFINSDNDTLRKHNIYLNYQRNEVLKYMKVFNLYKWKLVRSVVTKTKKKTNKLNIFIFYAYLICEQIYIDYSTLHYIENYKYNMKDLSKKVEDPKFAKTLMSLSLILDKYERYVERTILKTSCLHPAGFIGSTCDSKLLNLSFIVPAIGFAVICRYLLNFS